MMTPRGERSAFEGGVPPIVYVAAGAVVIMALARFAPSIGGYVLLAVVLVMLLGAVQKGVI